MGVGVYMRGRLAAAEADWLDRARKWFVEQHADCLEEAVVGIGYEDRPTLFVTLHPAAEALEISQHDEGQIVASAKTSTVGPGYHTYLCSVLKELGEWAGVTWDPHDPEEGTGDETGYFDTGDRAELEREMLQWLKTLSSMVVENGAQADGMLICMPMGTSYPHETGCITPLGPRELDWFRGAAEAPEKHTDFFAWWDDGETAAFFLNRALCRMWREVTWRPPITEEEVTTIQLVLDDLNRAHEKDPTLSFPLVEWKELVEALGDAGELEDDDLPPDAVREAKPSSAQRPIGYRRHPIRVDVARSSIEVPGSMAQQWEQEAWSAWEPGRSMWVSVFSFPDSKSATEIIRVFAKDDPTDVEQFEYQEEARQGRAIWVPYTEDGESMWNLKTYTATEGRGALVNFYVQPNDKPWALEVWKTFRFN